MLIGKTIIGRRQPTSKYAKGIVEQLKGTGIHRMGLPEFDLDWMVFKNGVLGTKDAHFRSFTPDLFLTARTAYNFKPKAECPQFIQFMREFCSGHWDRV